MSYGATASELDPLTAGAKDPEDGSSKSVFIDYTPPAPPADAKILPPAKHKLLFLAWVLVYAANYVALERMIPFLCFNGWASVDFALFLYLGIVVIVLVYGALDLSVGLLTLEQNGKVYGLGAWLKQPRITWLNKYENVLAQSLAGIIHIVEDGFAMFDAPPKEEARAAPKTYHIASTDERKQLELRVEHLIAMEKLGKYSQWKSKIDQAAKRDASGLVIGEHSTKRTTTEDGVEVMLCSTTLLFDDIEALNEWQLSPLRAVLVEELQELLVVPDVERLRIERDLPDAFTDIVARQGISAPPLPPKKWKVSWLLTISLYICIKWEAHMMAYYYEFWGWKEDHPVLQAAVSLAIVIFLNDYITVPLLLFLFDPWMMRKKSEGNEDREPWRTINEGFTSMTGQFILTLIFFGPNIIAMVM